MAKYQIKHNQHVIYGRHSAMSVLSNQSREIFDIFIAHRFEESFGDIIGKYKKYVTIVEQNRLRNLCGNDRHQGIVIVAGALIQKITLSDLINSQSGRICGFMMDSVQDVHNIGAIVRIAGCLGIDFLIISKHNSPSINSTIVRTSVGLSESKPIYTVNSLVQTIEFLKELDFCIIGLEASGTNSDISDIISKHERTLFILGSEGSGIQHNIKSKCDLMAKIAMVENVDSLNVASAATIIAYEYFLIQNQSNYRTIKK